MKIINGEQVRICEEVVRPVSLLCRGICLRGLRKGIKPFRIGDEI
jgi:hypothetical protein